jgi:hypothetical protein
MAGWISSRPFVFCARKNARISPPFVVVHADRTRPRDKPCGGV